MAVVQTRSLLSFSITSLVQLTRMGSLAGFLNNSKSLLGFAAGLGLARQISGIVGSGAQIRSGLATTYVWLPEKVKCG